ncbi:MAG: hypothetical protein AUJ57_09815 [Zetaproteobacteria bacterium CG1_02_53_45]|nr:MAG: hypothetical protein AUJ57_09815 [Zetaproteobacteria bacterium CG1_02_53_45]
MSTCVDQLLTGKIFQVQPDSTIAQAVEIMSNERISCILVVDDGQAVGIMTERDVMRLVHQKVEITQPVSVAMSSPVLSTSGDTSIYDAYEILKCGDIRHLVVTRYGKAVGVLTHSDLLRAVGMLDLLHKKSVIDVMLPGVSRVAPEDLLSSVIALMIERAVTTVVVTHNRKPVGVITERDIPRVAEELRNSEDITVAEVMSSPVITVDLHVSAYEVSELLHQHAIRQIIAVDFEGNLAGIITQTSLLSVFESRYIEHMRTQLSHAKQRLSQRVLLTNIMHSEIDTAIVALDNQMVIANSNPAASKIFSYQDVSLEGHTLQNVLIHGHFPSLDQDLVARMIMEIGSFRKTIVRGDGGCTVELEFSAIRSDDELVGYLLIANDMTEHLALEEQFQQSQKMESLGTLVGGIAHDFNNMLAGMTGNLYLARALISENPAAVERLDVVEKLSSRAARMIKQLMTFARKDSVQMKLLGLSSFFREVLQLNGLFIPENIAFYSEIAEQELVILGDETQLQQVVMNLLNNAHDAVWEVNDPKITLRLAEYIPDNEFRSRHRDLEAAVFARISILDHCCPVKH